MSLSRGLAKLLIDAERRAKKRKAERAAKKAAPKPPKTILVREGGTRLLTWADFHNTLSALEGAIFKIWTNGGIMLKQHISTVGNDTITVLKELFEDAMEEQRAVISSDFRLGLDRWFKGAGNDAEIRHQETLAAIKALTMQMAAMDHNWSDRWLEQMEKYRLTGAASENMLDVIQGTQIGLFSNLTEQIQTKQRVIKVYENRPTMEWLMERANELIDVGNDLEAVRDNDIPPNQAMLNVVKSMRALMGPTVSMNSIRDALDEFARRCGVYDPAMAA